MHPMLLLTGNTNGLIYLNGTFRGEVRTDAPLFQPISPNGAVYLEFRPFGHAFLPVTHRIVFSRGAVLPESIAETKSITGISWPFGISEIRISPRRIHTSAPAVTLLTGAGRNFRLIRDAGRSLLEIESRGKIYSHLLPRDAEQACLAAGDGCLYVSGDTPEGERFAVALSESGKDVLLSVVGRAVEFQPGGRICLTESMHDTAGRIRKTVFKPINGAFQPESVSIEPNPEGEFRPLTPEECALCLLEALIYRIKREEEACLAPDASIAPEVLRLCARCMRAAPLLFTPPDGRSAVALLEEKCPGAFAAVCIYYKGELINGEWKILSLST